MIRICALALLAMVIPYNIPAFAQTVGLSLPLSSRYAPVAQRMEFGAALAQEFLADEGRAVELALADDKCDPEAATETAERLATARVVVGPLCFQTAVALAEALKKRAGQNIPVISVGTRDALLERARGYSELPLYAIAHAPNAEAEAIIELGLPRLDGEPFAIIDDGSLHGRTLSDNLRLLGADKGFRPTSVDTFRPLQSNQIALLRRLQRAGIGGLVIAGGPEDVATIIGDMKRIGANWPVIVGEQASLLEFAEGDKTTDNPVYLVAPSREEPRKADRLVERLLDQKINAEFALYEGYALMEIAQNIAFRNLTNLTGETFDTILGPVTFGADGRAQWAPFVVSVWNGQSFTRESVGQ